MVCLVSMATDVCGCVVWRSFWLNHTEQCHRRIRADCWNGPITCGVVTVVTERFLREYSMAIECREQCRTKLGAVDIAGPLEIDAGRLSTGIHCTIDDSCNITSSLMQHRSRGSVPMPALVLAKSNAWTQSSISSNKYKEINRYPAPRNHGWEVLTHDVHCAAGVMHQRDGRHGIKTDRRAIVTWSRQEI
jgi:hypothetical protein